MARSFVVVAFLLFALCFSCILARKAPGVEPSAVNRKAPLKVPLVGPKAPLKAPLVGSKAPPKAPVAGPKVPLKAPLSGPKALLAGPKAPLTGTKAPFVVPKAPKKAPLTRTKEPVKAPFVVPKAPKKAPLKAPLTGTKAPIKAPFAVPKAPKKAPLKAPLAGPKGPQKAPLKAPVAGPKAPLAGPKAPLAKPFKVVGQIYCDPCHFEVISKRSTPLKGVKVNLECRKADSNKVTYVKEGITDANGAYKILVGGDHKGEICEVKPEQPRNGKCTEPMTKKSDSIVFTKNSSMTLIANPLGFTTKAADGQCRQDDKELNSDTYVEA